MRFRASARHRAPAPPATLVAQHPEDDAEIWRSMAYRVLTNYALIPVSFRLATWAGVVVAASAVLVTYLSLHTPWVKPLAVRLTEDEMQLRWLGTPRRIRRSDILAVHADNTFSPKWWKYVIVETRSGPVPLKGMQPEAPVLVPLLQEWAGVGAQAERRPDPSPRRRIRRGR